MGKHLRKQRTWVSGNDSEAGVFLGLRDCEEIRLSKGMAQRGELGWQALALGKGA